MKIIGVNAFESPRAGGVAYTVRKKATVPLLESYENETMGIS